MEKDKRTNIKISRESLGKLKDLKNNRYESYNATINRLHNQMCKTNSENKLCEDKK